MFSVSLMYNWGKFSVSLITMNGINFSEIKNVKQTDEVQFTIGKYMQFF
jgi:hypothetical protein